ncbi:MAG: DUF1015 domain-containing protein [Calditrichaeota bacterium]|nr:MAG: DUF1015 domain-containing protein [Calditrichota bacterium]
MANIRPFTGLRPNPALADKVAALPYDVIDSEEARELAKDNPYSFWHITKPEIDLPVGTDIHSAEVYKKGAENLRAFRREHILLKDSESCFYLYQQIMGDHTQTGFVACASVDEYINGFIKKHEHTRPDKVQDRVDLMKELDAQTGPVFLAYRQTNAMAELLEMLLDKSKLENDFVSYYQVRHRFFRIDYAPFNQMVRDAFTNIPALYIADGHHRSESAAVLSQEMRRKSPDYSGNEEYHYFLTVIFPHSELKILPYNRVVKDLNGLSEQEFLHRLAVHFSIEPIKSSNIEIKSPQQFGLYLGHSWYLLKLRADQILPQDAINRLDVSVLQNLVLAPILGIDNPRTDKRIHFIGGIRGNEELVRLVDQGTFAAAFAMFPTSMEQVMAVADTSEVMPPKSTWFEPKLLSGLVTHLF